jgi:TnpA family transposase
VPAGVIYRQLIKSEAPNMDRIVATLGLKDMTEAALIRKVCTMPATHRTRRSIFEFDKLIRSIYALRYLLNPRPQHDVHRSQNRVEAYHSLRAALSLVSGKKELIGRTELDVATANECGQLVTNIVVAFNSILLSSLVVRYETAGNSKILERFKRVSPVAWHYKFKERHPIGIEALLARVETWRCCN